MKYANKEGGFVAKNDLKQDNKKEIKKDNKKVVKKVGLVKSIKVFFKSVWSELKKVVWPTKTELKQHASVVIGIVFIMTVLVWAIDFGLGGILSLIITR